MEGIWQYQHGGNPAARVYDDTGAIRYYDHTVDINDNGMMLFNGYDAAAWMVLARP